MTTSVAKQTTQSKICEKQKQKLIDAIIADNPEVGKDTLSHYYIERMVESYLLDPNEFNRRTSDAIKADKKKKKEGEEVAKMPEEIVCISKVEAEVTEESEGIKDVVVT